MSNRHLLKKCGLVVAALALVAPLAAGTANTSVNAKRRHFRRTRVVRRRNYRRRGRRNHKTVYKFKRVFGHYQMQNVRPFKGTATSYCETLNTLNRRHRHFGHLLGQHFRVVAYVYGRHNLVACKIIYRHHVLYADPNAINNGINSYGI